MTKYVNKVYNENGRDQGLIISVYQQGNQWIANVTNDFHVARPEKTHQGLKHGMRVERWQIDESVARPEKTHQGLKPWEYAGLPGFGLRLQGLKKPTRD